jgi:hypothetical protein
MKRGGTDTGASADVRQLQGRAGRREPHEPCHDRLGHSGDTTVGSYLGYLEVQSGGIGSM